MRVIYIFFCLLMIKLCAEGTDSAEYFQKAQTEHFPLGEDKTLTIKIPPEFDLDYSNETDTFTLYEFVPKGETVENWTKLYTIVIFNYLAKDFQSFAWKAAPKQPVSWAQTQLGFFDDFRWGDCISICDYIYETCAVKYPEMEIIEGFNEFALKTFFQGDQGLYMIGHSVRYDANNSFDQKEKIWNQANDLFEESAGIWDYTLEDANSLCTKSSGLLRSNS